MARTPAAGSGHAVVVGGSGMLAGLCHRLAAAGWSVSVVGRDPAKLHRVVEAAPGLHPVSVDYLDLEELRAALDRAAADRGRFRLAVCWVRSWAPQSLLTAASALADEGTLIHVVGNQSSQASAAAEDQLRRRRGLTYRRVRLGAVTEAGRRRWLTHAEISDGVYDAVVGGRRDSYDVGTVS